MGQPTACAVAAAAAGAGAGAGAAGVAGAGAGAVVAAAGAAAAAAGAAVTGAGAGAAALPGAACWGCCWPCTGEPPGSAMMLRCCRRTRATELGRRPSFHWKLPRRRHDTSRPAGARPASWLPRPPEPEPEPESASEPEPAARGGSEPGRPRRAQGGGGAGGGWAGSAGEGRRRRAPSWAWARGAAAPRLCSGPGARWVGPNLRPLPPCRVTRRPGSLQTLAPHRTPPLGTPWAGSLNRHPVLSRLQHPQVHLQASFWGVGGETTSTPGPFVGRQFNKSLTQVVTFRCFTCQDLSLFFPPGLI